MEIGHAKDGRDRNCLILLLRYRRKQIDDKCVRHSLVSYEDHEISEEIPRFFVKIPRFL